MSWTGDIAAYDAVDVMFSATTTGLPGPGYISNVMTGSATGYTTQHEAHTVVAYADDAWPVFSAVTPLAETDPSYLMHYAAGVGWNPVSSTYLATWNRTDQATSQEVVMARTVDPTGTLGGVHQISEVQAAGEMVYWAKAACSTTTAACLVAWQETEPVNWYQGIRARLVDGAGSPLGSEIIVAEDASVMRRDVDVVYNPTDDEFLVLYTNDGSGILDVAATRVRAADGVLLGSAVVATGSDGDRSAIRGAHLSGRNQYLLVYDFEDPADNEEVHAKLAPGDLSGVGAASELILASGSGDHSSPVVAAEGDEYLVAWTYYDASWPHETTEIRARRFAGDGTPLGPAGGFLVDEFAGAKGISTRQVRFAGEQGFLVGWFYSDPSCPTGGDLHGRFVELGADQAAGLEFPTVEDFDGVDASFVSAWRTHADGFEDGGFGGWSTVAGATF